MDLRELRYFIYVAELKSFSKASVHLRIAQPALSRQVRKLEEELGVDLLVRSGRGLELTEAGRLLLQRAYGVLRQVTQTCDDVRAQANTVAGTITLGVPPAAGEMLLPPVIETVGRLYPDIRINVVEGFSGFLYERLLNQELTLGLMHNPAPHRDLEIQPLLVEHMYLVGPAATRKGVLPAEDVRDLANLPLILPGRPHSLRLLVEHTLTERCIPFNLKLQVDGLAMIRALVANGEGYTVLTYGSVYVEVQAGRLSARPLEPEIAWTLAIASRIDQRKSRPVQAVIRVMRAEIHRLVENGMWRGDPHLSPEEAALPMALESST